jgi:hypothetical protein
MPAADRPRSDRRILVAALLLVVLAACGGDAGATDILGPDPLPDSGTYIPAGVRGVTSWAPMPGLPPGFDIGATHASAADAGDAFGSALTAEPAAGRTIRFDTYRLTGELALLVITESGAGDDSVAGAQYALELIHEADSWRFHQVLRRTMCRRGVDAANDLCV